MADTPDVDLEVPPASRAAALLLHPHPDYGGNRFNIVVDACYRGLPPAGIGAARFDFAGSDLERAAADTVAAIGVLAAAAGDAALVLVGYSFGALVAGGVADPRLAGWVLVNPPFGNDAAGAAIGRDPRPKLVITSEHDQFCPPSRADGIVAGWEAVATVTVPGADHFLGGRTATVVEATIGFVREAAR